MVKAVFVSLMFILPGLSWSQCDTLLLKTALSNAQRMLLNEQSIIKDVPSNADLEITMVLSPGRKYAFEIIGHRDWSISVRSEEESAAKGENRTVDKVIIDSEAEKDGQFVMPTERTQHLAIFFDGVTGEKGSECTGVLIYSENK
jgi:hypothetical protein